MTREQLVVKLLWAMTPKRADWWIKYFRARLKRSQTELEKKLRSELIADCEECRRDYLETARQLAELDAAKKKERVAKKSSLPNKK